MNLFAFRSYKDILAQHFETARKNGRGEMNRLAEAIGVHASLLSQILNGPKNLSLEQSYKVCHYLGFTAEETDFFLLLVQHERAGDEKLRKYFKEKLEQVRKNSIRIESRIRRDRDLSEIETATFYSHPLYAKSWLLTSIGKGQTAESLSKLIGRPRAEAVEILRFLTSAGLCDLKSGVYSMASKSVHVDRSSPHLARHHTAWRLKAVQAFDNLTAEELMYTAPISISHEDFRWVREKLAEVIKEITSRSIASQAETVACLNIDFFLT